MRGLLIALLCLLSLPAAATQDAWPALYDVTGVAASDVLNIRERPNSSAPIVGVLSPAARNVELIRPNDRETWALVNTREGSGWVSLKFLKRQQEQWLGKMPPVASCAGTEPFWGIKVNGQRMTFSGLAFDAQSYSIIQSGSAQNRRDRYNLIGSGPSGTAIAAITMQACTDGMSDRDFGLTVDLFLQGTDQWQHLTGCCSLSP
tara:strand:+ start:100731 stop:101342 length:612 start_codon:yes stop_codon:yes gene_type:complete